MTFLYHLLTSLDVMLKAGQISKKEYDYLYSEFNRFDNLEIRQLKSSDDVVKYVMVKLEWAKHKSKLDDIL